MHTRQLIILCALLGSTSALQADTTEDQHSPWAQRFTPDSPALQSPLPTTASSDVNKTLSNPQQLEIRQFNQAFEQLKAAEYSVAIVDFKQFIQAYPQSEYRSEARYWIGEAHYLAKDYPQALAQFSHVIIYFAESELARQAMLKSADTYRAMQDFPQAKRFYQRVIKNYPGTTYAVKAAARLRQLP